MNLFVFGIVLCLIFSGANQAFALANYGTLENRFYTQPVVCIYEPEVSGARQIIIDTWLKETEIGIKNWEYELQANEYLNKNKWHIEVQKISLEQQLFFDNKYCDVEVRFVKIDPKGVAAGWHIFDGSKSQISLVYTDKEVCNTWIEGKYRYVEWCYKDDLIRSKTLGNVASHEFGHAIGLKHYVSDNPNENYEWSSDPYASPSIMTLAVHYDEDKNKIRQIDINKVREIYGADGFGDPKPITHQNIIFPKEKNFGGFESFFTSQSEYLKKKGTAQYVTISGKVTEEVYSRGQNVLITVLFPDNHEEELKALTVNNREFSIQIRVDDSIQTGVYTLNAKYMGYDSNEIHFTVLDSTSDVLITEQEVLIPHWIRNNAKWWAEGTIHDKDFVMGMQFLVQQNVIHVKTTEPIPPNSNQEIPSWIRNNAKWWTDGLITDSDFVKGIEYLAQTGVIRVN